MPVPPRGPARPGGYWASDSVRRSPAELRGRAPPPGAVTRNGRRGVSSGRSDPRTPDTELGTPRPRGGPGARAPAS
eukprot:735926-Hanusia_phi.AAC.1